MKWREQDTRGALVRRALLAGITAALALSFTAGGFSATAQADTIETCGGGGTYTISAANVVTGNSSCQGAVTIPSGVTRIGESAFGFTALTSVTIPSSVTNIDAFAFSNSGQLATVTFLGNAPTTVGAYAFDSLASGARAVITEGATGFGAAGSNFYGLVVAGQDDTIENCGVGGGTYFVSSTHVVTGNLNCAGAITLPADVTAIADNAFAGAPELTSVTIPASVTSIGASSFYNAPKLTSLTVAGTNATFSSVDGVLFNKAQTNLILYPRAKAGVSYAIPQGVTSISENAFRGANVLASVTIPVGVTTISNNAFRNANLLASVTIPSGVTRIGEAAFQSTALTSVTIPSGVTEIGDWAFTYTALTSVTIPSSVTIIGTGAFNNAGQLATVTFLGNAPTTVGGYAFGSIAGGARALTTAGATGFGAAGSNFYGLIVTPTAPVTPLAPNTDWGRLNDRSNTVVALIVPEVGVTYSISGTQTATKAAASGKKTIRGSCKKVKIKKGKKTVSRVSCRIKLSKGKWLVSITPKKKGVAGKTSQKTFRVK